MEQFNAIGFDTRLGYRTAELLHGDLTLMVQRPDVMVVSTYAGSYDAVGNSLIQQLLEVHGIDAWILADSAALDLRDALGIWVSSEQSKGPAKRYLFVEMRGGGLDLKEVFDNVFATLSLMDAKHIPVVCVATPLLGAGAQRYEADEVVAALIPRVRAYLSRSPGTSRIQLVERSIEKVRLLSEAMDKELGRVKVTLPYDMIANALRQDVANRLAKAKGLFADSPEHRDEWTKLLQDSSTNAVLFSIQARKLVELYLSKLGFVKGDLYERIHKLSQSGRAPPWICAYMNVIRQLGNDAAHEASSAQFRVAPGDLMAGLFCLERLLDFWIEQMPNAD